MDAELQALVRSMVQKETEPLRLKIAELEKYLTAQSDKIWELEAALDETEQYSRKTSLILSGGTIPEPKKDETPAETREITEKVIKEKLGVEIKGGTAACHRLNNKKRVLIKFVDLDDRDAVMQAKFDQTGEPHEKVKVHENLTPKRADMVKKLGDMWARKKVANYHTRNGVIMARNDVSKRYSRIQPWYTEDQILEAMHNAPLKRHPNQEEAGQAQGRYLRSPNLDYIPRDAVMRRPSNLQDHIVGTTRSTRANRGRGFHQ